MIEKLRKNTKIKIISLLSALVLWMYVMAVVDPEDTKLYEDIPITITNLSEIKDLDLIVASSETLTTDVYVKGSLSNLQKINQNNIKIYGTVSNPIEGQNQLSLKASVSDKVTVEFKSDIIVINLEKKIDQEKEITVNVTGQYKNDVDSVDLDKTKVTVSGPRSNVNKIKYVQATYSADEESSETKKSVQLELKALDSDMNEVDGISLEFDRVSAEVSYLQQKTVKINPVFSNTSSTLVQDKDFTMTPTEIYIKGKSETLSTISYINTKEIDINEIGTDSTVIDLDIPNGINAERDNVTIKMKNNNNDNTKSSTFTYSADELSLTNNEDGVTLDDFELPDSITVKVEYDNESDKITKKDLQLYVDLSEGLTPKARYSITHNDINVKNITINPSYITAK